VSPLGLNFGFVSICLSEHNCSPAGNVTVKTIAKHENLESKLWKIKQTAKKNLHATFRIVWFNKANDIKLYRLATDLIPLATHEVTNGWSWWNDPELQPELVKLGEMIRETKLRVSTHPPQVCVFNASDEKIFQWVRAYLRYHIQLFSAMGLTEDPASDPIIVFHLGSSKAPFNESRQQIETNFASLTEAERQFIVLENDDKTFSARQVLEACEQLGVPMVLDYHHHLCRNDGENVYELLPRIFATWKGRKRPPKVHLSSP